VKGIKLEVLTTSELLDLRDYADLLLKECRQKEGREIERTLARIAQATEYPSARGRTSKLAGTKVPPKYRNRQTGETWAGRGATPRWLRALMKKGHKLEEFAIAKKRGKVKRTKKKRS
jgi:DNA-binding protein H-NS